MEKLNIQMLAGYNGYKYMMFFAESICEYAYANAVNSLSEMYVEKLDARWKESIY